MQYLYQIYCDLDLTFIADRPKAILGLEKRLARSFKSRADFGVLWNYFERMLLWRAEHSGTLSRILDTKNQKASPSWSWTSRAGRIRYLDVPFNTVSWQGNLQNPFGPGADKDNWDGSLCATANKLLADEGEISRGMVMDDLDAPYDRDTWLCVVLGKNKTSDGGAKKILYVLMIQPLPTGNTQAYERVGVGILHEDHISADTASVCII